MNAPLLRVAALLLGVIGFPLADAAIVLLEPPEASLDARRPGLDEDLLSLPDAVMGPSQAIERFQRLGIGDRGFEFRNDLEQFSVLLGQAGGAYAAGEFEQAQKLLEAVLEQRRGHAGVQAALADTLIQQGKFEEARRWADEARLHGVKLELADWLEVQCLAGLGKVDEAQSLAEALMMRGDESLGRAAFECLVRMRVNQEMPFSEVEAILLGIAERTGATEIVMAQLLAFGLQREAYERAQVHAGTWVDSAPDQPGGYLAGIHALRRLGQAAEAERACIDFIKRFPQRVEGYLLMADALARKQEYASSLKLLDAALSKVDEPRDVRRATLQIHLAAGNAEAALKLAVWLLRGSPTDSGLWQGFLLALNRHLGEAEGKDLPVFSGPEGGAARHVAEAHQLGQEGDYALATRHMIRALFSGDQTAGMFNDAGCLVMPILGADVAVPFFQMALIAAPNYREAARNLSAARGLSNQRQRLAKIDALAREIDARGSTAFSENELGEWLAMEGRIEEAVDRFRRALDADPANARALLNLGQVQFRNGALSRALRTVGLAVEHAGGWLEPVYRHSWLLLQQANLREDDLIKIVTCENQLINQDEVYYQALGRLLRAERYLLLKSSRVAQIKAQDCFDFARDADLPDIQLRAREMLNELDAREAAADEKAPANRPARPLGEAVESGVDGAGIAR